MKYSLATSSWGDEEIKAIQSVIESDMYSMGQRLRIMKRVCSYFGAKYAVMCSSGSTANLIMTAALFYTKTPRLKEETR